jgi:hypothetical protein
VVLGLTSFPWIEIVPGFPGFHTLVVLLVTVLALYAFTRDKWPLEATGLVIVVVMIISFKLFQYD